MVTSILDLPNFFVKGSKLTEVKPFFSWTKSSTYYVYMMYMRKSKKITKDNNNFK